jgi:translation initiation factor IF-2
LAKTQYRVHILAKELGVKSKSIVEKCQAEGLDVKNHMSTLTAGQAASIREWFSEGEHTHVVETTDRVDLEEVRVAPQQTEPEPAPPQQPGQQEAAPAVTLEAESAAAQTAQEQPQAGGQEEDKEKSLTQAEPEQAKEEAEKTEEQKEEKPQKTQKEEPVRINVPQKIEKPSAPVMLEVPKPVDVKPAGPQLSVPKPAKLSGPKVVRVEAPVEDVRSRPRKPRPQRNAPDFAAPPTEKLMDALKDKKAKKGKKQKEDERSDKDDKHSKKYRMRDIEERRARLAAARGETLRLRPSRKIGPGERKKSDQVKRVERPDKVAVSEPITVKSLSAALSVKITDIIKQLMKQGLMATANQAISTDVAELVALEFGVELFVEVKNTVEEEIESEFKNRERNSVKTRHPVVTMLGHVDHGKTSLLDRIRSASVAAGEAGGITQHIGAHFVNYNGHKITFLDTPGHAAFTAMRARGANMTDIVILVCAADDGVMPQTKEAINHAQAAKVPIIVALNKIDLPGVDVNKIYGQLSENGLVPSEWGGDTEVVKTSAQTGEGIDNLIEAIELIAELHELKADPKIPAMGWVVESKMTQDRGVVATLLIREGTLKKGDVILAGVGFGRLRTMRDSQGKVIAKAGPSMPVEVTGLSDVPSAGDKFYCLNDQTRAKNAAEELRQLEREKTLSRRTNITLDNLFSQIEAGNVKELNLIIRADVQGSVDVLIKYLSELNTDEVKIKVIHAGVGGITEGDVVLAEASGAIIIGFNVVPENQVKGIAEERGVDIRLYNVIYRITEELRDAMAGMLEPEEKENILGRLTVRDTFRVPNVGTIAGCYVNEGLVRRNSQMRLIRNNVVVKDNCKIDSLKHFKDDVREVKSGYECGINISGFDDIKVDDQFEVYEIVKVARTL